MKAKARGKTGADRGRKRKPPGESLTGRVLIPVRPADHDAYVSLAEAKGMSVAEYGRLALRNLRVQMESQGSES